MVVFWWEGENRVSGKNLFVQRREPTNSTYNIMTPDLGIEPGPHRWEVSALTTAPSLHPKTLNQHLVVRMFPKTGWCSLIPYNIFLCHLIPPKTPWEILQHLFLWHSELRNVALYCNNSSSSLYHLYRSIIPFSFLSFSVFFLISFYCITLFYFSSARLD